MSLYVFADRDVCSRQAFAQCGLQGGMIRTSLHICFMFCILVLDCYDCFSKSCHSLTSLKLFLFFFLRFVV